MKTQYERLAYLDGLRGVAALIVIVHHYLLSTRPELANGDIRYIGPHNWIPFAPFMGFWAGNLSVCIFFVLSGFVLARMSASSNSFLLTQFAKRLIRLGLPITASMLIGYSIWRLHLFHNIDLGLFLNHTGWIDKFFEGEPVFATILKDAALMPFTSVTNVSPVLWTMHIEYVGSALIFLLYACFKGVRGRLLVWIVMFGFLRDDFLMDFLAGAFLWEWISSGQDLDENSNSEMFHFIKIGILLLLSILLGLYPWSGGVGTHYYAIDNFMNYACHGDFMAAHRIAAVFIVAAVIQSRMAKAVLSSPFPLFLGRTSFAIYLLHFFVICSIGAILIMWLSSYMSHLAAEAIVFPIILIVSYGAASLFTRLIDVPATRLSQRAAKVMDGWIEKFWNRYITGSVGRLWHRVRHGQAS